MHIALKLHNVGEQQEPPSTRSTSEGCSAYYVIMALAAEFSPTRSWPGHLRPTVAYEPPRLVPRCDRQARKCELPRSDFDSLSLSLSTECMIPSASMCSAGK